MTRRHVHNEPFQLTPRHSFQLFRNNPVMTALDEAVIHMMHEWHELIACLFAYTEPDLLVLKSIYLLQNLFRDRIKLVGQEPLLSATDPVCPAAR